MGCRDTPHATPHGISHVAALPFSTASDSQPCAACSVPGKQHGRTSGQSGVVWDAVRALGPRHQSHALLEDTWPADICELSECLFLLASATPVDFLTVLEAAGLSPRFSQREGRTSIALGHCPLSLLRGERAPQCHLPSRSAHGAHLSSWSQSLPSPGLAVFM